MLSCMMNIIVEMVCCLRHGSLTGLRIIDFTHNRDDKCCRQ